MRTTPRIFDWPLAAAWRISRRLRRRPTAKDLLAWAEGLSEEQLFASLASEARKERQVAAMELCRRDPDRSVEPIVAAIRRSAGRQGDEPPDAKELLELGLHNCKCTALRRVELFTAALLDERADPKVRSGAAWALMDEDDPKVWEALRAAAGDSNRSVRSHVKQVLDVKETLRGLPPDLLRRAYGKDA